MKTVILSSLACICILSNVSRASEPETPEAKLLSSLVAKVIFLCDFATNFQPSPQMQSSWKALADPSLKTENLIRLLKSSDPKVRSLAIFALDRKYDPRTLPEIADLQSDQAPSYPCPAPVDQWLPPDKPEAWPTESRTVGALATGVVNRYLSEAGYTNFSEYWKDHQNRSYSVSWFALSLRRVWGPRDLDPTGIEALRGEVAKLPSPDRQWTTLWLGTLPSPNNVVRPYSDEEMIRAAAELGHEALLQLLDGRIESTDPDLRVRQDSVYRESLRALQTFVLTNSPELLAKTDSQFLLQEKFNQAPWYAVGAAQLDRKNASAILRTAFERFNGKMDDYNRAVIVLALWNLEGERETDFILDWFYNASMGHGLVATPRHQFLRDVEKQNGTKPLIAALIRDQRFNNLDWNSLHDLVRLIGRWLGRNLIDQNVEGRAGSDDPKVRDAALSEYRRLIRSTIPQWLPSESSRDPRDTKTTTQAT